MSDLRIAAEYRKLFEQSAGIREAEPIRAAHFHTRDQAARETFLSNRLSTYRDAKPQLFLENSSTYAPHSQKRWISTFRRIRRGASPKPVGHMICSLNTLQNPLSLPRGPLASGCRLPVRDACR